MIVVTGAAGFIGSALAGRLLNEGYGSIVAVDDFSRADKMKNLEGKNFHAKIERESFLPWLENHGADVQFVFHMGARTDTSEFSHDILNHLNLDYSKALWTLCVRHSIPLIYASSAATYGDGSHGFRDDTGQLKSLTPLNPYGWSKHHFDLWVMSQVSHPPFWAGFKFFNVFGPNEYHKHRMASVVYHAYHQIRTTGSVKLFRSHKPDYADGMQLRDFIYIRDVLDVLMYFMEHRKFSDIYNLGSGTARSFNDLAQSVFRALGREVAISYTDIPEDIRDKYQYYTCANMDKIRDAGYRGKFTALEDAVQDYVNQYLEKGVYC